MLVIKDLVVRVDGKNVLNGVNLTINSGEVHAIMGPNGSGKSTLAYLLAGRDGYEVIRGTVRYKDQDLLAMEPEARAAFGLFLAFQYPLEIPGVTSMTFLKTALEGQYKKRGLKPLDTVEFLKLVRQKSKELGVADAMLKRPLNVGFSGGEKKRFEVFQMAILEPSLAILDETDSGLDIDALKDVARAVNAMRDASRSFMVITHYQRLLDYIVPDKVHVLMEGTVVRSGGRDLVETLEKSGYAAYEKSPSKTTSASSP